MDLRPPQEPHPSAKQMQGQAIARAKLEAMSRRARRIRRYVAGSACALFLAAFLSVYVQLASGNDPALVAASKRTRTATLTASSRTNSEEGSSAAESSDAEASSAKSSGTESKASSSGAEATSEESPSPVTTSQS